MKTASAKTAIIIYSTLLVITVSRQFIQCTNSKILERQSHSGEKQINTASKEKKITGSMQTFQFASFGNESSWTAALQLHKATAGDKKAGGGAGLLPNSAPAPVYRHAYSTPSVIPLKKFIPPPVFETALYQQAFLFFHTPG